MIKKNIKKAVLAAILTGMAGLAVAQSNTATTSGSIGKCETCQYPYTLYNTSGASQNISDGITVTVDQNRNIGAVNLAGNGAMDMNGANGITLSGSGSEISCRWDIPSGGSYTLVNNGNTAAGDPLNTGVFFTAPYAGNYIWIRGNSGWSAGISGAFLNGGVLVSQDASGAKGNIFYQDQPGSCGLTTGATGTIPPTWSNAKGMSISAGGTLSYRAGTAYSVNPACKNTTLTFSLGNAFMVYDN